MGLAGCSQKPANNRDKTERKARQLTDDDIANYAAKVRQASFRQKASVDRQILGLHNGARVVAEFPYLDDGHTKLGMIHYDVKPGEACRRVGGVARLEWVPAPMAMTQRPFCVPKVLVERNIRTEP